MFTVKLVHGYDNSLVTKMKMIKIPRLPFHSYTELSSCFTKPY